MIHVDGSLKVRMAILLLVMISILGTLLMLEAYFTTQRAAQRAYDSQLEAAALTIAEAVQWEGADPVVEIPAAALQILATQHQERVFYAVLDHNGNQLSANLDINLPHTGREAAAEASTWLDLVHKDTEWRIHGQEYDSAGWEIQNPVQIWVGHTLSGRQALASELFDRAVIRFVAMVLLAATLMILAMRVALKPMRQLRHQLRRRQADDIRPLDTQVPEEMRELAEALDTLFARQRKSRDTLLRFTADASHQLKTPLAGLQSTSELALKSRNPDDWYRALEEVHGGTQRTSRLAGQLLSLARLRHIEDTEALVTLDLKELLHSTVLEWAGREVATDHDLGLSTLPSTPMTIKGEPWALRELLGNLIDNAIRYTPAGSEITLGLEVCSDHFMLFIEDDGPGVDPEGLSRIFQPFERGSRQDTEGSGLGLAIVDSIAKRHDAELHARARLPHGLRIELHFPPHEENY